MGLHLREKICEMLQTALAAHTDVAAAYLFGSVARGEDHASSDIDVGLLFVQDPPARLESMGFELQDELTLLLKRKVDLVVLNHASCDLVRRVMVDGLLLVEHSRSKRIAFEVRKRNEYFDMLPLWNTIRHANPKRLVPAS
jgi:uncharacterized protein